MKKYLPVILAIVIGISTGLGSSLVDILKPYSALIATTSAFVVAIVSLIRQKQEE